MTYLRALKRTQAPPGDAYPMTLPLLRNLGRLAFPGAVTLVCGDNGSGKTTLMELLAGKINAQRIDVRGAEKAHIFLDTDGAFAVEMVRRPRHSFFFQAEDFIRYVDEWFAGEPDPDMVDRYGNLCAQSHGEGFLSFFGERIGEGGLYLLDEPEAALSPANQLVLLHLMLAAEDAGCQLIISTHSPVLLAYPGACIYELLDGQAVQTEYADLAHIQLLRAFLNDTEGFIGRMRS